MWSAWRIPTAIFSIFWTGAATFLSSSSSVVPYTTKIIEYIYLYFCSTVCEGVPSEWEEVHSQSQDCNSKENTRSLVPATASFQRTLPRLHITGNGKLMRVLPKATTGLVPIGYRGTLLSSLLQVNVYVTHNLLNVLVQIANKMGLKKMRILFKVILYIVCTLSFNCIWQYMFPFLGGFCVLQG
jgi:hypothetical protein